MKKALCISISIILIIFSLLLSACSKKNTREESDDVTANTDEETDNIVVNADEEKMNEYILHYYFELVENESYSSNWNFIVSHKGDALESGTAFSFEKGKDASVEIIVTIESNQKEKTEKIPVPFYGGTEKHSTKIVVQRGTKAIWNFVYWYEEV